MRSLWLVATLIGACSAPPRQQAASPPEPLAGPRAATPSPSRQNIARADYVGPAACGECHAKQYASWRESLHATMNQLAGEAAVIGDFSGARAGGARFLREGGAFVMRLGERRFRVTRTIGTRYLQEYVGVEEGGPGVEIRLPFGWWRRAGRWMQQQYYDSWYGPEYLADGSPAIDPLDPDPAPWATRCAWCHNTYAFELRARRPEVGQGLEQYFEPLTRREGPLPAGELVTVGISCESCHLGGREHAEGQEPIFVPASPELVARADAPDLRGGRANPVVVNTICAQCHSTPTPKWPSGAAIRNSSEALDMAAGACMSEIKCTDCHDPHVAGPAAGAPEVPRHAAACTGCHDHLAAPEVARAHARHDPASASCLDCHMPRLVQGLSSFVRSHRISLPVEEPMLAAGAPNACNLCHLDRSIAWTLEELAEGWGRRLVPAPTGAAHDGGLDAPAGEAWLASEDRAVRLAAAGAWARSKLGRRALPRLRDALDDPVAHTRMWTLFAIEDILGRKLSVREYDPTAPPATRTRQVRSLRW